MPQQVIDAEVIADTHSREALQRACDNIVLDPTSPGREIVWAALVSNLLDEINTLKNQTEGGSS